MTETAGLPAISSPKERCSHWRAEVRQPALALHQSARELPANLKQIQGLVEVIVPGLTSLYGIGPVSATQAVVSFSHPGRCRDEAAFAAVAGTNPLPASSGRTVLHRLNRGGDRTLNRAVHPIALTRMRSWPTTRAYVQRRSAQGKTIKEIRRCLYITRELYRALTRSMTPGLFAQRDGSKSVPGLAAPSGSSPDSGPAAVGTQQSGTATDGSTDPARPEPGRHDDPR